MSEKARYMTFYENWVEVMEMCTPDEWYELTKIITNLRFKNIDTDPKTIPNIKIKMAWNLIRPSILKSNRNTRYQDNKANKTAKITPNEEFDNTVTTELPIEEPIKEEPIETTVEEFEKDNYSDATYDFLDENDEFIKDRVLAIVNGKLDPNNADKQYWMTEAYRTIKERCFEYGYYRDTDTYREITDVIKSMINNRIEIAAEYGRE